MRNPFKKISPFLIEPLKFYYNIFKSLDVLKIEDVDYDDKNCVIINNFYENLYCVELAGAGENKSYLPDSLIDSLYSDFAEKDNSDITWVLLKDGINKKNLIFTQNKKVAQQINNAIPSQILEFEKIANILLSLYFNNDYSIDYKNKKMIQKYTIRDEEYKNPLNLYNESLRERTLYNYNNVKYYQTIAYNNDLKADEKGFDIENFFKIDFKGALFTKIILSEKKMFNELEAQKENTAGQFSSKDKKIILLLEKSIKEQKRAMINSTLLVFEDYGNTISTTIERLGNCTFDLVQKDIRKLVNKTPILAHNKNFSRIIKRDFLYQYICSDSKLDSDKPDLVGLTQNNTFVNFGFKKATQNNSIPKAHTILLGTSGAGKTQAANDIFKQLTGFDYKTGNVDNLAKTNHVIFDIKDSFYNQVNSIKKYNEKLVDMNDFDKSSFMYNIVDCDTKKIAGKTVVDEGDLTFAVTMISLILNSNEGNTTLTSGEQEEFKSTLRDLYVHNNFEKMTLNIIETTHNEEYQKLIALGYNDFTQFDEIKEDGYEKFKKPLLYNVLNVLREKESNYSLENRTLKAELVKSLLFKLETIEQIGIFSNYSKLNFKDKPIIYFRTDSLLESGGDEYGYMVFAMQSILVKIIKRKQHKKRLEKKSRPMVYFWYEEARNIFSNKLFREKEIFQRIINEWRSFDMVFFPITQEPQHIPDSILNGFEIKMMLVSGDDEEEKAALIESLKERLSIGKNRMKMLSTLKKYTMLVMYGDGAFTMKFKDDADFRELVNT